MRYSFIDESGDLGLKGSRYFIISAVSTDNPDKLRRIIKRVRQRKLKKQLREVNEIKGNNSTPEIRKYVLSQLTKQDCELFAIAIDKNKIINKHYETQPELYHFLCRLLLDRLPIGNDGTYYIIIDQKDTNKLIKRNFEHYVLMKFKGRKIKFSQLQSFADNGLLVVDFVAWAVNRKWNANDDSYFNIIYEKIVNKNNIELWKNKK